jgi:hypothetical protein
MRTDKHTYKKELYIGLDVHKDSITVAVAQGRDGEMRLYGTISNDLHAIEKLLTCARRITGKAAVALTTFTPHGCRCLRRKRTSRVGSLHPLAASEARIRGASAFRHSSGRIRSKDSVDPGFFAYPRERASKLWKNVVYIRQSEPSFLGTVANGIYYGSKKEISVDPCGSKSGLGDGVRYIVSGRVNR